MSIPQILVHVPKSVKYGYFPDLPQLKHHRNGKYVTLLKEFEYVRPDGKKIIAPPDFFCDGASIPKIVWPIAGSPFTGSNLFPAIIHDWLCYLMRIDLCPFSSEEAHYMFYCGLKEMGENEIQARTKWQFVLRFGPKAECNEDEYTRIYGLPE